MRNWTKANEARRLPPGVQSKHIYPLTKWHDSTGCMAHHRKKGGIKEFVDNEAKVKAEALIRKEYSAVIGKEAIEDIAEMTKQFIATIAQDDRVAAHKQYAGLLSVRLNATLKIADEMLLKEQSKRRQNTKEIKWLLKYIKEMITDAFPEFRKTNFELDEMQHGKKRVNINADAGKINMSDFLETKPVNVIDSEVVHDSSEGDTDKE